MTIWLPAATRAVDRAFWQRRPRESRWWLFGGCLFWLSVFYLYVAWIMVKVAAWAVVLAVLAVAQVISLAGELAWWPVAAAIRRQPAR